MMFKLRYNQTQFKVFGFRKIFIKRYLIKKQGIFKIKFLQLHKKFLEYYI